MCWVFPFFGVSFRRSPRVQECPNRTPGPSLSGKSGSFVPSGLDRVTSAATNGSKGTLSLDETNPSQYLIGLLGTCCYLRRKLHLNKPQGEAKPPCRVVRFLWTWAIGEDQFENGGIVVVRETCAPRATSVDEAFLLRLNS